MVQQMHTATLPNRLRELRKGKGEKVYDLSALIRRDTSFVYRLETGRVGFSEDILRICCDHYEVTPEFLLGWDRDESAKPNGKKAA